MAAISRLHEEYEEHAVPRHRNQTRPGAVLQEGAHGFTIRGGVPDRCWLPGDWSADMPSVTWPTGQTMPRGFTSDELILWRTRCAHRRLEYKREFTRDQRPPYLVRLEAL